MSSRFVPDHIARHIDSVAQAHLCRQAGVRFDQTRRMRAKRVRMAKMKAVPTAMRVLAYDLSNSELGSWRLQWSEDKKVWVLIALNPSPSTGVPRMKIFSDRIRFNRMVAPKSPFEARLLGMAEAAITEMAMSYDYDSDPHIKRRASAVIVGDVFYSTWGYDQTNLDYYQVVGTTPKMLKMRKIDKKLVSGRGQVTEYYMPQANKFTGSVFRKKLGEYNGKPYVSLTSYSSAYKWGGKPVGQTGGAYGH